LNIRQIIFINLGANNGNFKEAIKVYLKMGQNGKALKCAWDALFYNDKWSQFEDSLQNTNLQKKLAEIDFKIKAA
jgi:hypothetical protein